MDQTRRDFLVGTVVSAVPVTTALGSIITKKPFKAGDVVRATSGGRKMTVRGVEGETATCDWFEGTTLRQAKFHLDSLEAVPAGEPRVTFTYGGVLEAGIVEVNDPNIPSWMQLRYWTEKVSFADAILIMNPMDLQVYRVYGSVVQMQYWGDDGASIQSSPVLAHVFATVPGVPFSDDVFIMGEREWNAVMVNAPRNNDEAGRERFNDMVLAITEGAKTGCGLARRCVRPDYEVRFSFEPHAQALAPTASG